MHQKIEGIVKLSMRVIRDLFAYFFIKEILDIVITLGYNVLKFSLVAW